jgi:hypothetical protein
VATYTLTGKPIATDVHTESTHKGIDALQDRFDDLEVLCLELCLVDQLLDLSLP